MDEATSAVSAELPHDADFVLPRDSLFTFQERNGSYGEWSGFFHLYCRPNARYAPVKEKGISTEEHEEISCSHARLANGYRGFYCSLVRFDQLLQGLVRRSCWTAGHRPAVISMEPVYITVSKVCARDVARLPK